MPTTLPSPMPRAMPADQHRFMNLVFEQFTRTAEWPATGSFQRDLDRRGESFDLVSAAANLPWELGHCSAGAGTSALTIRGVGEIAPTSQEIADFVATMKVCCRLYLTEGADPKVTAAMLRESESMDDLRLKKLLLLLDTENFITAGGTAWSDGRWERTVADRIRNFIKASSFADYVAVATQLEQKERKMTPSSPAVIVSSALGAALHGLGRAPIDGPEAQVTVIVEAVEQLHARISAACRELFGGGHYPEAVQKASIAMRDMLRELSGSRLDGVDLAGAALTPNNPLIVLADLETETGKNIQRGTMLLAQGVFASMRNVVAHEVIALTPVEALEMLGTISLVVRRLDLAKSAGLTTTAE
jgi:uncharacterized protein (TIGR02391 family)